jgi:hypothetical protein
VRTPSTTDLLAAWEQGLDQPATRRALALLAAGCPEVPERDLARVSIGRRDAALLALRERCFGPGVVAVTACPSCGEQLELAFDVADIRSGPVVDALEPDGPGEPLELREGGYQVSFRLPDSLDVLTSVERGNPAAAGDRLLERCLVAVAHQGRPAAAAALPPEVVELIEARMAEADPQADVSLALVCSACDHCFQAPFDVAAFLWREVDGWARQVLRDVHLLASAYGWRETDVLALSPWRRRFYLEAVTA